ncbi:DNA polymerase III subunit epsilon [Qipengyuania sp. JC766]|uniref:DNA polymerase III subunit epsilon n=1 Tax=Qipengyuania sp. JC766 TaxID=3232139 RepID=UPI00345ACDF3
MREIVFDTETTGFDPKTGDRMVEIGCVELVNRLPTGKTLQLYFNPERAMPPGAFAVHGLSDTFLAQKPLFRDQVEEILEFLEDSPLVAHNAGFDMGFLNAELALCERDAIDLGRMIDTVEMARKRHPGGQNSLDGLCKRYGIDRSHRVKHGALLDAELLAQVYIELTGGRQMGLSLAAEAARTAEAAPARIVRSTRPYRAPRPHAASAAELQRHEAFIKAMDNPIWSR